MKIIKQLMLFIATAQMLVMITSCEKTQKIDELKAGDKIGKLIVKEVTSKNGDYTIMFKDEIIIEKTLIYYTSPHRLAIGNDLLSGELEIMGKTIDLSIYNYLFFENYEILDKLISSDMLDGEKLKGEYIDKIPLKVIVNGITLKTDGGFKGHINSILEFNGQRDPKPKIAETKKLKVKFDRVVLGSGGGYTQFIDKTEKSYIFFDDGNKDLHAFFDGIKLNDENHKYKNTWFDIEYQIQSNGFFDGSTGNTVNRDVEVITSIKISGETNQATGGDELSLFYNKLKKMSFTNGEGFILECKTDYMEYSTDYGENYVKLSYQQVDGGSKNYVIIGNDMKNQSISYTIGISEKHCEIGVGDENFPYSVTIRKTGTVINIGCGKIRN